ncbi:glycosyltransferase family 4 protein [Isoptericola chiayiensis]|uniref:Glycosyltransferase family 4 protein n=1 Tax=Isoptericola chiayiensis TaxID=579446 RepID=A0ABP8Y2M6_9MICO|nr:glycosyltransferase family 4 protein [Isoptericola chiayiensis]
MRVTIIGHTARESGAELALCRLLGAVDRVRLGIDVVLFEDGPLVDRLAPLADVVTVMPLARRAAGLTRGQVHGLRSIAAAPAAAALMWRLAVHLARERPDVVVTTTMKAHVIGSAAAAAVGAPLVWHVHDRIAPDYMPAPLSKLLRAAARVFPRAVVANSRATAATLPGVRNLVVAYPGFSTSQAIADPASHVAPARPVVLLLGRISPTKGQLELARAMPSILARHPGSTFRIVGSPIFGGEDYAGKVQQAVRALGVSDHVTMLEAVDDPRYELDEATVLVHASPVPEPFGQVVVEAMVRGVPVIATDAGGVPEILVDRSSRPLGWLVPPGDADALAAAVIDVLDQPAEARRRASEAYAAAHDRFRIELTAELVTTVWRRAGRRSRGSPRA